MKWQRERDLLIAQTMAFVQSVTGRSADADPHGTSVRPGEVGGIAADCVPSPREVLSSREVLSTREVLAPARLSPLKHGDLREEIQRRVAAFRARQQLFDRDRSEYCNATLARARAITEQAAKASDPRPTKR